MNASYLVAGALAIALAERAGSEMAKACANGLRHAPTPTPVQRRRHR